MTTGDDVITTGSRPCACSAALILAAVSPPATTAAAAAVGAPTSVTLTSTPSKETKTRRSPEVGTTSRTCVSLMQPPPSGPKQARPAKARRKRSCTAASKSAGAYAVCTCSRTAEPAGTDVAAGEVAAAAVIKSVCAGIGAAVAFGSNGQRPPEQRPSRQLLRHRRRSGGQMMAPAYPGAVRACPP